MWVNLLVQAILAAVLLFPEADAFVQRPLAWGVKPRALVSKRCTPFLGKNYEQVPINFLPSGSFTPSSWILHGSGKFDNESEEQNSKWRLVRAEIKNQPNTVIFGALSFILPLIIALILQITEFTTFTLAPIVSLGLFALAFGGITLLGGVLVTLAVPAILFLGFFFAVAVLFFSFASIVPVLSLGLPLIFSAFAAVLAAGGLWNFFISDWVQTTTDEKQVEPPKPKDRGALKSLKELITRDDLELMDFDLRLKEGTINKSFKKPLEKWTYNDVALAAEIGGLESYFVDLVLSNRIDGRVIKLISEQELRTELGVEAFGDRKRFMIFIEELRSL